MQVLEKVVVMLQSWHKHTHTHTVWGSPSIHAIVRWQVHSIGWKECVCDFSFTQPPGQPLTVFRGLRSPFLERWWHKAVPTYICRAKQFNVALVLVLLSVLQHKLDQQVHYSELYCNLLQTLTEDRSPLCLACSVPVFWVILLNGSWGCREQTVPTFRVLSSAALTTRQLSACKNLRKKKRKEKKAVTVYCLFEQNSQSNDKTPPLPPPHPLNYNFPTHCENASCLVSVLM